MRYIISLLKWLKKKEGTSGVAQSVKLPTATPTIPSERQFQVPASLLPIQLLLMHSSSWFSSVWAPAIHGGDTDGVSGSWLQAGPSPSHCRQLGSNSADATSLFLSNSLFPNLFFSAFQINTYLFLKNKKRTKCNTW